MDYFSIGFTGLFFITFLSATVLTFPSEIFLIAMLSKGFDPITCLFVATIGNSLGSLTNYGIGRLGNPTWLEKVGMNESKLEKRKHQIQKYGSWLALISWVPIIGDPLMICLGYFRVPFLKTVFLMTLSKFVRYLCIVVFYI